ncbi:MAG: hypothetical protein MUP45_03120 [Candidatus Marinimicrobia bacterium]|nr:hypothetical protein [Candidatus Neomarinimicrobiota bacterium]
MKKQVVRKTLLLSLREIYLSSRNIWGLLVHPYRTLRAIRIEEDFSQAFLLIAFPFYLWLSSLFIYLVFKLILFRFLVLPFLIVFFLKTLFYFTSGFLTLWCGYVAYWLFYYLKVKRRARKEMGS